MFPSLTAHSWGQSPPSFDDLKIPVLLIDRAISPFERSDHDLVGIDNLTADHFATLGVGEFHSTKEVRRDLPSRFYATRAKSSAMYSALSAQSVQSGFVRFLNVLES